MSDPVMALHELVASARVLSLATLEEGAPAVSLTPFAAVVGPTRFYLLLSELSSHTVALRADPRCGWMIHEAEREGDPRGGHGLARLMGRATARWLTREEAAASGAEGAYRARSAVAEVLLGLRDFHFCELSPVAGSVSFVQGFGRAYRVTGDDFGQVVHVTGR